MSKTQKLAERKKIADQEALDQAKALLEEKGLGFNADNAELPPEDVDDKEVAKSAWETLKSFVPYTNAYYEAQAAEDEMGDLRKIRIEKVKAGDLFNATKTGNHEEALESMMAETNNDFFYFNRLRTKMEAEGKFTIEKPLEDPFSKLEKGAEKNRLKKAFRSVYSAFEGGFEGEGEEGPKVRRKKNRGCGWKGRNDKGESLKCQNIVIRKARKKVLSNPNDPNSKLIDDPDDHEIEYCPYHTLECIMPHHAELKEKAPISVPNFEAMCMECYVTKRRAQPPAFKLTTVPGIINGTLSALALEASLIEEGKYKQKKKEEEDDGNNNKFTKKDATTCQWKPNPNNENLFGFVCNNLFFQVPKEHKNKEDPEKNIFDCCGYHLPQCYRDHPSGGSAVITVPNEHGLCSMHYLAEFGVPPEYQDPPYPGMEKGKAKDFWKRGAGKHWASPDSEPPDDIVVHYYEVPEKPTDFIQKLILANKKRLIAQRRRRVGKEMCLLLQTQFRMYQVRNLHRQIGYVKKRKVRLIAALTIQAQMRRFLETRYVQKRRVAYNTAALFIQRVQRGFVVRRKIKVDWGARRITKFMKKLRFFKFKDTVIMVMQLRLLFVKKMKAAAEIQRVFRGHLDRKLVFTMHLWKVIQKSTARKIQKAYRLYVSRKIRVFWQPPSEQWVMDNCGKILNRLIHKLRNAMIVRRLLKENMAAHVTTIQKNVRRFLSKCGAIHLDKYRTSLRDWTKPIFATEYYEAFLRSKNFFLHKHLLNGGDGIGGGPNANKKLKHEYVRPFLPEDVRTRFEVDKRIFEPALKDYYHSIRTPLVQTEMDSIIRKFKNPINGYIQIGPLDDYIAKHAIPCRKHGRTICGDCVARSKCMIKNCQCAMFVPVEGGNSMGICKHCSHAGTLHTLLPLLLKDVKPDKLAAALEAMHSTKASDPPRGVIVMLDIIHADREPDMSMPTGIEGVEIESKDVIIPPPDPDDIRLTIMKNDTKKTKEFLSQTLNAKWSLSKSLANMEIAAEETTTMKKYWGQKFVPIMKGDDTNPEAAVMFDVPKDNHTPDYEYASKPGVFWNLTSKNPNKSVRDYNEKFDHNMPVPIIDKGQLVYTFEGGKVYYNIVCEIIKMDKSVDYDHPDFLKLVTDNIQIFERHWRKMVHDIRVGKLDRKLTIPSDMRKIFDSTNLPLPDLAKRLDVTFRRLGFHKKVLGKDIKIQTYAKLKRQPDSIAKAPVRKRSLPNATMHSTSGAGSLDATMNGSNSLIGIRSILQSVNKAVAAAEGESGVSGGAVLAAYAESNLQPRALSPLKSSSRGRARSRQRSRGGGLGTGTVSGSAAADGRDVNESGAGSPMLRRSKSRGSASPGRPLTSQSSSNSIKMLGSSTKGSSFNTSDAGSDFFRSANGSRTGTATSGVSSRPRSRRDSLLLFAETTGVAGSNERKGPNDGEGTWLTRLDSRIGSRGGGGGGGASGTTTPKRRGSETDVLRPTTAIELNQIHYNHETAARDSYTRTIETDGDRYVCPFPACGKSFHSREAAFLHLPEHEQRQRLYAPTALVDSHLNFYWPEDAPWKTEKEYTKRSIPPGSLPCPYRGCHETFPNQMKLQAHVRLVHKKIDFSSVLMGYFFMSSFAHPLNVPPNKPDRHLPLKWCPEHAVPKATCHVCVEADSVAQQPKPPFKIYEGVTIDFTAKKQLLEKSLDDGGSNSSSGGSSAVAGAGAGGDKASKANKKAMTYRCNEWDTGVVINMDGSERRARVISFVVDRNDNGWLLVEPLYSFLEANALECQLPSNFNRRYELLPSSCVPLLTTSKNRKMSQSHFKWVLIKEALRGFSMKYTEKSEIDACVMDERISKVNTFYVRNEW